MSLCVRKYQVYHMYRTRRYIAMGMHLTRLESMRFFASTRRDSPKSKRRDLCVYSICLQGIGCLTLDALLLGPSLKQQKPKFESSWLTHRMFSQGEGCLEVAWSLRNFADNAEQVLSFNICLIQHMFASWHTYG